MEHPDDGDVTPSAAAVAAAAILALATAVSNEIREQLKTALPTLATMLLYRVPWLISLRFVGGIGADELAAAALATTLCNVTGMSLSVGLSSAMTTLAGQARGDCNAPPVARMQRCKHNSRSSSKPVLPVGAADGETERSGLLLTQNGCGRYSYCEDSTTSTNADHHHHKNVHGSSQTETEDSFVADQEPLVLLPLVFLYRGLFIQLLFVLPIGLWWLHGIEPLLLALGQGPLLSAMTDQYLRILAVGLWAYSINWTVTSWLQAMEMADVPAYAAAVGLVLHVPANVLFIYTLDYGYLGCAVATVVCQLVQPVLVIAYLFFTPAGTRRVWNNLIGDSDSGNSPTTTTTACKTRKLSPLSFWPEAKLAVTSVPGILQYLGLALPGIVAISEWWASEVCIFLAGRLSVASFSSSSSSQPASLALGAMTLYQSINSFCFMFPVSFSIAGSARVGHLLGAGKPQLAELAGKVSILCAGTASAILGCILYLKTPHTFFPLLFAPTEHNLALETSLTIPLLAIYVFADGIQAALNGIIKGCGRQVITMPIVVLAYWVVAVPLAYYLAFVRCNDSDEMDDDSSSSSNYFCGIVGLVTGLTIGTWLHMLLLSAVVLVGPAAIDWDKEAVKAKARVGTPAEIKRRLSATQDTLNCIDMLSI